MIFTMLSADFADYADLEQVHIGTPMIWLIHDSMKMMSSLIFTPLNNSLVSEW